MNPLARRSLRAVPILALTLLSLAAGAPAARAEAPPDTTGARMLLTWHAPAGQRRASSTLLKACGDTLASDTLYLCLVPGADSPTLNGFTAELRLHVAPGDSLARFWRAVHRRDELTRFEARFAPDSMAGAATPFLVPGLGHMFSDLIPDGVKLRLIFAVPIQRATPIRAGQTYVLAQVLVHRAPRRDPACRQTLCVEWVSGTLALVPGYEPEVRRGQHFVALHGPVERVCAPWDSTARSPRRPGSPALTRRRIRPETETPPGSTRAASRGIPAGAGGGSVSQSSTRRIPITSSGRLITG